MLKEITVAFFFFFNLDDILQTHVSGLTMHVHGRNSDGISQILLRNCLLCKSHTG